MDNQPFVTLSTGGMQPASRSPSESLSDSSEQPKSSPASSISATTHDTSRTKYHINELSTFVQRLEAAATKIFPNKGRSRYENVQVLLLRWEQDTMGVQYELDDLAAAFAKGYGFKTETWLIPSTQPHLALMGKAFNIVQDFGVKDNLLIVYYAGHGGMNSSRQPLWTCTGDPSSPYLQWYAIQTIFEQAEADVLLLLDCCAAASSAPADGQCNSVTETIAACGFETWAPQPGRHSFTNTLIAVLDDWQDRSSFTAAMLHCEILNRLRHEKPERRRNIKNFECRRTPVHILSTVDARAGSVELCRRNDPEYVPESPTGKGREADLADAGSAMDIDSSEPAVTANRDQPADLYSPDSLNKILATGETALPHVLISLALEEEQLLDLEQCRKWLQQFPALAKYAQVQSIYKSNSTLMILSVPVLIWDWLPDNLACSFIGYVHSTNLFANDAGKSAKYSEALKSFTTPSVQQHVPDWQPAWCGPSKAWVPLLEPSLLSKPPRPLDSSPHRLLSRRNIVAKSEKPPLFSSSPPSPEPTPETTPEIFGGSQSPNTSRRNSLSSYAPSSTVFTSPDDYELLSSMGDSTDVSNSTFSDPWYPIFPHDDHAEGASDSPHIAASKSAATLLRKRDKPLPPIVVDDPNDTVAMKRARNTLAARKSRQRKMQSILELEEDIAKKTAERDHWKKLALGLSDESPAAGVDSLRRLADTPL
ncbi:hypothetical protein ONS95_003640 [Cadophora gregata]|uniref:uncharacterized protein n=1 Tax=Cadophora gregata TaxID=51156 RepID=UPI0026DD48B1|nr:uncharacterized protein ONS95_003640 [Cadophora gregata]KAK0106924.1 hypothetical protein ONS95_003640 [Cadophora gregata]